MPTARRWRTLLAATMLCSLLPTPAAADPGSRGPDAALASAAAESGRLLARTAAGDVAEIEVADARDAARQLVRLRRDGAVVDVEPDQRVRIHRDPLRAEQWELDRVRVDAAFDADARGDGVTVAVLDTGVDGDHEDLAGQVLPGYDATTRTERRRVGDVHGHGTMVAGTIAAATNRVGGRGVAPSARILPVKVLTDSGDGRMSDVAAGVTWAAANGADVINLSLGGEATTDQIDRAIAEAVDAGVVVVTSAGNLQQHGNPPTWPASHPDTVAVAALRPDDTPAPFSSSGDFVTVAAPGTGLLALTTDRSRPYARWSGTSAAAPVVAGALAVAIAAGDGPPADRAAVHSLKDTLIATAQDVGPRGFDPATGHGVVRVDGLVAAHAGSSALRERSTPPAPEEEPEEPEIDPEPLPEPDPVSDPVTPEPTTFEDVAQDSPHRDTIATIRDAGVTEGCAPRRFCPEGTVTRGQMATFLVRARGLEMSASSGSFADVPPSHTHAPAVEALASAGITSGCDEGRFCPDAPVRRDQMASFLTRAYGLSEVTHSSFLDVRSGPHLGAIGALLEAGITGGCQDGRFCPDAPVRRDQMASFLARAMASQD